MIDSVASKPFSAITLLPAETAGSLKDKVIELSRHKYAKSRAAVEREIESQPQHHSNFYDQKRLF
jgi:hypothetical protein